MPLWKNKQSIVFRVTAWYSIFIVLLLAALLTGALYASDYLQKQEYREDIYEALEEIVHKPSKYERFDDGIYFVIYNNEGKILKGEEPQGFGNSTNISKKQRQYIYYDTLMHDGNTLRGIMLLHNADVGLSELVLYLLIASPFLLFLIVYGGYRIQKKALAPLGNMITVARNIQQSGKFTERISLASKKDEVQALGLTLNEMIDSIDKSISRERQFHNDISHELRTPLSVILAESEYALRYPQSPAEQQESLTSIVQQAKNMKAMIVQMLDFARMQGEISKERLDLSTIIQATDYSKLREDIHIDYQISGDNFVQGNALLLTRLVDNLASNAIKFAKSKIQLRLHGTVLEVEDDGAGIPLAEQEKIWHRFYQVDSARNKSQHEGTGLGLAIVKQIADLHGAKVSLQSREGVGTCFRVEFPVS